MNSPLIVETTGHFTDLVIVNDNAPVGYVQSLLRKPDGIVHALNQDGLVVEMMLDMDQQSVITKALTSSPFAPDFVVGHMDGEGSKAISALVTVVGLRPPHNGAMRGVDGLNYTGVQGHERFDAVKHIELLSLAAGGVLRQMDPEQQTFVRALRDECEIDLPIAVTMAQSLVAMAAMHRKLCAIDSDAGLSPDQEQAQAALESSIDSLVQDVSGINGPTFVYDPSGTTVGLRFESGHHNSLTNTWKVPADEKAYNVLEGKPFWEKIKQLNGHCHGMNSGPG